MKNILISILLMVIGFNFTARAATCRPTLKYMALGKPISVSFVPGYLFKLTDKARKALARVEKSGKQINFWGVGEFPEKFTDAVDSRSTPAGRLKLLRGDIEALGGTVLTLQLTGKRHFKFHLKGDSRVVTFVAKDDYVSKIVN